eukprot:snap_masked-scaffold_8-processed-gene-3.55-mRNA-1 protein AED:0.21 eAED:0.25 QI:0/1/0.8/1/1/1/5/193/503
MLQNQENILDICEVDDLNCTFNVLSEAALEVEAIQAQVQFAIDVAWYLELIRLTFRVLYTAIGIIAMQLGFGLLEAGTAQVKNVKAILIKNFVDNAICTLCWWVAGFAFFAGDSGQINTLIGFDPDFFFLSRRQNDKFVALFPFFVQQFGFATTAATIVSGGIMSRMKLELYAIYVTLFSLFCYPVAAHWGFVGTSWLKQLGFQDFAGSGVVHMVGGVSGLVGAKMIGPRLERFFEHREGKFKVLDVQKHSTSLIVQGTFVLYIGWFSFNAGSSGGLDAPPDGEVFVSAALAIINTLIASAAGAGVATIYTVFKKVKHDVPFVMNGLLSGLVAITGPCATVEPFAAVFIGASVVLFSIPLSNFILYYLSIDDPLDVGVVHGFSGAYGLIMLGLFDRTDGVFYGGGLNLLEAQAIGMVALSSFSAIFSILVFGLMRVFVGIRVSDDVLRAGLDTYYHKGTILVYDSLVQEKNRAMDAYERKFTGFYEAEQQARETAWRNLLDKE